MRLILHFRLPPPFAATLIGALAFTAGAAPASSPAEALLQSPRPLVIAHRGYSAVAPENTLPAFARALEAGADLVELDYHHSKDGALVVLHDATLDRTTDATNRWSASGVKVADRPLADLRGLQAGLWFNPPHPDVRLPTLDDALDVIQRGGVTLIERKAGDAAACVKLLRDRGLMNRVVVQASDWDYLRDFRRREPRQILGALGPPSVRQGKKVEDLERFLSPAWLDEIKSFGARIVVWNKQVTLTSVQDAHERGLKVWVYTINDEATARQLLAFGVDGLITDNPAIIWKALAVAPGTTLGE
jgi:glycerophosphoryl diester phosphodiesterase